MRYTKQGLAAVVCLLLVVIVSGVAMANGIRINPPPYHFGGDALFCEQGEGCELLDKDGNFLWSWAQADVDAAFAAVDQTGANTQIGENGEGTYGTAQLWALPPEVGSVHDRLCFFGYDEWGKTNFMCFIYTAEGVYLPVGMIPAAPEATKEPVADCTPVLSWTFVQVIGDDPYGLVTVINFLDGTVTFLNSLDSDTPMTVSCDMVKEALL
jgi:hypothetical protein